MQNCRTPVTRHPDSGVYPVPLPPFPPFATFAPWLLPALYLLLSLLTFGLYGMDKHAARHSARRVPEMRLHMLALLGGWPGAWLGQRVFRHTTVKSTFQHGFRLCVFGNCCLLMVLGYLRFGGGQFLN